MDYFFIGNDLSVDFVNTEIPSSIGREDLFLENGGFKRWVAMAQCTESPARCSPREARNAVELRRTLRRIFEQFILECKLDSKDLANLNKWARQLVLNVEYEQGTFKRVATVISCDDALARIAYSACELMASERMKLLRRCARKSCCLYFIDVSRNQNRIWCQMETCGNRDKSRKHPRSSRAGGVNLEQCTHDPVS